MSQIIKNLASGPVPPNVPTSFVTDSGTVVPAGNIVNINGGTTTDNNPNGIKVIANPDGSNNEVVELTNRITGSATTTDGTTPVTLYTFNLGATPGTYLFTQRIVGYNVTDAISGVYSEFNGVRTTGAAAIYINNSNNILGEEGTFTEAEVVNSVSGNNVLVQVIGQAGKTIHWLAVTDYIFVS